ncbi:MAG: NUDIX domain-containing protein [Chlamydiia bacterium]
MEKKFYIGVKAIVRNQHGQILVLQSDRPNRVGTGFYWDLPGGRMAEGEDTQTTLRRELLEELGTADLVGPVIDCGVVLSDIQFQKSDERIGLLFWGFACELSDQASITLSNEHLAYAWASPEEGVRLLRANIDQGYDTGLATLVERAFAESLCTTR